MAIEQNFDKQWSFAKDYSLLKQLSQVFEDGFYLQIHTAKPDHYVNFAVYYEKLLIGGTPFFWLLLQRELTNLIQTKHAFTDIQKSELKALKPREMFNRFAPEIY